MGKIILLKEVVSSLVQQINCKSQSSEPNKIRFFYLMRIVCFKKPFRSVLSHINGYLISITLILQHLSAS